MENKSIKERQDVTYSGGEAATELSPSSGSSFTFFNLGELDERGFTPSDFFDNEPNANIRNILLLSDKIYHSPKDHQDELKSLSKYYPKSDKDENLSPLGSFLLALENLS